MEVLRKINENGLNKNDHYKQGWGRKTRPNRKSIMKNFIKNN